jgi:hypothetical protein
MPWRYRFAHALARLCGAEWVLLLSSVHAWHDTRLELGHAVEFAAWMLVGNLLVWPLALWAQRRNAAKHAAGVIRD